MNWQIVLLYKFSFSLQHIVNAERGLAVKKHTLLASKYYTVSSFMPLLRLPPLDATYGPGL